MLIRLLCSGGSTGIGAATVKLLVEHGANVVFGDINVAAAHEPGTSATFLECDVTKYDDIYQLFKKTYDQYGRIDHAISCAGTFEQGNWFDPNYTIDSIREHPGNTKVLDVNLTGTLHFARIAAVFLRESRQENNNKSLTLLSSVNAFRDSPGLYLYQTSKHAIQGILRSTRKTLHERHSTKETASESTPSVLVLPILR